MIQRHVTILATPTRRSDVTSAQKARVESLRQADLDRAEKRLKDEAQINVNAAKWRYVGAMG